MRKSTVIASCLVNSNIISRLEDAESTVVRVFGDEFPSERFVDWNTEIDDGIAQQIINNVGRASRIDVGKFIQDLLG